MKYFIIISLLVFWVWYFYDMGQNKTSIEEAKINMWIIEGNNSGETDKKINEDNVEEKIDNSKPYYNVINNDDKNFIQLDDLTYKVENITDKITISWKVLNTLVDKIVIGFENTTSDFENDKYTLQTFKKWKTSFEYNADSIWFRNLDYWLNKYLIESYVWNDVSSLELEIFIPENIWSADKNNTSKNINDEIINNISSTSSNLSNNISFEKLLIGTSNNSLFIWFPKSDLFWNPNSSNWVITYSNISWLKITKSLFHKKDLTLENIWKSDWTWYLNKNVSWYLYWNSFREIDYSNKDLGVSFYLLIKNWEKYSYEKHYFDFNHNILWILKIKEFDKTNDDFSTEMSELNTKLKELNDNFEIVKTTDKLFKEIVR